jgi:phage/plasmid-associated DNA primase
MTPKDLEEADDAILGHPMKMLDDFKHVVKGISFKKEPDKFKSNLAFHVIRNHHYCWVGDKKGEFRKWYNGKWYKNVEHSLNRVVRKYLEATIGFQKEVRDDIRDRIKEENRWAYEEFDIEDQYANFLNGILDLETLSFHPHGNHPNKDLPYFTIQIPYDYKTELYPKKFTPWLYERLEGDWQRIDIILKYIGYCLTLNVGFQKMLMLKDGKIIRRKGKTGKSSLINIVCGLVGHENFVSVSLQRLSKRFGNWGIVGKLLNYYPDLSTQKVIRDTGKIKLLIDKFIDYEVKMGAVGVTAKNTVKHLFSAQAMTPVYNLDLAYCRRWLIVEFNKRITNPIPDFEDTIIKDVDEMVSIISLCIDAYLELVEEKEFKAQSAEDVMNLILVETDEVYRFLVECCDIDGRFQDDQEVVYQEYADFAAADGVTTVKKKPEFTGDLYSKGFGKARMSTKNEDGKRPYTYTGFKLKSTVYIPSTKEKKLVTLDNIYGKMVKDKEDEPDEPVEEEEPEITGRQLLEKQRLKKLSRRERFERIKR